MKTAPDTGAVFTFAKEAILLDSDLGAAGGFAGELAGFDLLVLDDAVFGSMNREVVAHIGAGASLFGFADLSDDNTTGFDLLAAKQLNAKSLAR
jgi:hypothetical protein